jgi:Holliday junction resolvase RusA-like endonuclease
MSVVAFEVHGEPVPQGSKTVASSEGKTWVRDDNRKLEPWRNAVSAAANAAMGDLGRGPIAGPVELEVIFVFARPKAHYRTGKRAGELKPSAPHYCAKIPDVDKLVRAIGDAITGTVVVSDATIVKLRAEKHFGPPAAYVTVRELVT